MKTFILIAIVFVLAETVIAQENPCNICPDGVTAAGGEGYIPDYDGSIGLTCAELIAYTMTIESGSEQCAWFDIDKEYCCPPGATISPTTTPIETSPSTAPPTPYPTYIETTLAPTNENQCVICRKGVTAIGGDDYEPFQDGTTCAEMIQAASDFKTGTYDC
jgi:hypothetical protein